MHQAATVTLSGNHVQTVEIRPLTKSDAKTLATEVLAQCGGPASAAEAIALKSPDKLHLVAEAYARYEPSGEYSKDEILILQMIFEAGDPMVLRFATSLALQVAKRNPTLAVELICKVDFTTAGDVADDFFMWLTHQNSIPAEAIREDQWRHVVSALVNVPTLDGYWIRGFLKKAIRIIPDDVISLLKARLAIAAESKNWAYTPLRKEHNGEGLALMNHENGERVLRDFLDWAVQEPSCDAMLYTIGDVVAGLCGSYDARLLDLLLSWMSQGIEAHALVVSAVLRNAQGDLIYEFQQFVRDILYAAEVIGTEAVEHVIAAISSATWSGPRGTAPGEPFPEDLRLEKHATEMLGTLSRLDPAYELFSELLREAKRGIARQRRVKEAMDADEEE
ncbi:hypothetical protein SAMN04515618_11736 [Collimonas sp. OK307]|uniref:hypothetical protein n=1 Tax=Collimonas sp. OK307 TaxID=1801620 RepID=UPI0008F14EC1|nr:hypothetical protein [Collimonas sp. OK307]SFI31893.1 hypothetical protein SAMN04515618_11736 [Collimonas sp. OK307]